MPRLPGRAALIVAALALAPAAWVRAEPPPQGGVGAVAARAHRLAIDGRHQEAVAVLRRALTAARAAGDWPSAARLESLTCAEYRTLGRLDEAEAAGRRALAMARRARKAALEAEAWLMMSAVAADRGDQPTVAARLGKALPLAERSRDDRTLGRVLDALGRSLRARGARDESLRTLGRAIEAATRAGDTHTAIRALGARSTTLLGLGRYDEALIDAQHAYDLGQQVDDPSLRAAAVFGLAQVHAHVWNLDRSIALWTEAIELYRQARLRIGVALATKQRMEVWSALGDFDRAATDGETVLRLFEDGGTAGTRTEVLSRLALVELNRGHADAAAGYAARAAVLLPDTIPSRRMYVLNDLGLAAIKLDRPDEARARFEAVGELARSLRDPEYEWRADYGLGLAALADRRPADAQRRLEAAIALVERSRRAVAEADLRAAFMSERVKPYESLVDALMAQSTAPDDARARRAFDVAEQARGRALADLLAEARARLTDPSLAALRRDERAFSRRLSDLQKALVAATSPADRERREAALDRAELDYDGMIARVRRENPAYAALAFPAPVGASDVMRALQPDEALIAFSVGERRGFAWILRRTGLSSYRVPGADRLSADVRLATALATGNDAEGLARVGRRLYGSLVAPAAASLAGAHRLIVVPAGPIERLPLSALRTPDEAWLAERFALSVVPSATVLSQLRRRKASTAPDALLAVSWSGSPAGGGPRAAPAGGAGEGLGSADAEVRDVAREVRGLSGAVRLQIDETEDAFKHAPLDRYRALHLAAHARIDEVVPRRSAVLLGPDARDDGLLQLNEIGMLHLNANVVVLATCRSQVGRLVRGEGLMSLSRMFIYAGARSVVASLWAVDDAETRTLMQRFYGALADGYPPDTALQQAQIAMIRQGRGPSTWAAFTVAGHAHVRVFPRRRSSLLWGVAMLLSLAAFGVAVRVRRRRTAPHP